jgi:hypothetical protein
MNRAHDHVDGTDRAAVLCGTGPAIARVVAAAGVESNRDLSGGYGESCRVSVA